jgi:hypothetical protein
MHFHIQHFSPHCVAWFAKMLCPSHPFGKHINGRSSKRRSLCVEKLCPALRVVSYRYRSTIKSTLFYQQGVGREAEPLSAILALLDYASLATR